MGEDRLLNEVFLNRFEFSADPANANLALESGSREHELQLSKTAFPTQFSWRGEQAGVQLCGLETLSGRMPDVRTLHRGGPCTDSRMHAAADRSLSR
jgi:hypothetical protein